MHVSIALDATTGLPATALTPPTQIINKTCTIYHSEKPNDPNWEDPVQAWASTQPDNCPSGITGSTGGGATNNGSVSVTIVNPQDGDTIYNLPFTVTVSASSPNQIARVDLSIDGQFYQSANSSPFTFQISGPLTPGDHSIAVKAVDSTGQTSDTSMSFTYATGQPQLMITDPPNGSLVTFPLQISAQSPSFYNQATFYNQVGSQAPVLIGPATNVSQFGDQYQYTTLWAQAPVSGIYKIYVQNATGVASPKITITVP